MDKSEGIWRRLLLMPMNVRIPVTERKVGMDKEAYWIAAGEAPGILNWALAGLRRLRESGWHFTSPAACRAALAEHRLESDPARAFLLERYEVHADAEPLAVNSLYQEYRLYCDTRGHRNPMNDSTFGRQVRRVFPVAHSKVVRCGSEGVQRFWFGLGPAQGGGGVPRGTAAGSPVTALPMPGKPLQEP